MQNIFGVVQNCHRFQDSRPYTKCAGGGGSMVDVRFLKNVYYYALHMHTGSLQINIFKVLFWEGGSHKIVLCVGF